MRYIALSHKWGGKVPLQLNASTKAQLLSGIAVDLFLRAFRDAIIICRRLRYRYLWVDPLCIEQDNRDDWCCESLLMSCVYRFCEFSIAAWGARDSHGGCFVSRNPLECLPCILGNHCPPGEDEYFYNYENGDSLIAIGHRDFPWHGEDLGRAPLTMRAWVLQERCWP
jgi:hypothetical protein